MRRMVNVLMQGVALLLAFFGATLFIVTLLPVINPYHFYHALPHDMARNPPVGFIVTWYAVGAVISVSLMVGGYLLSRRYGVTGKVTSIIAEFQSLVIVCLTHDYGYNEENYPALRQAVESFKPDYWEFLKPGTIFVYFFDTKKNAAKADALVQTVQSLIDSDEKFKGVGIGRSKGEMTVELTWGGRIKSAPMGAAGNEAMKKAKR